MEKQKIKNLVKLVVAKEIQEERNYPYNLGGREIRVINKGTLSLDDWVVFHNEYRRIAPANLKSN